MHFFTKNFRILCPFALTFTSSLLSITSCQLLNPKWIAVVSLLYPLHATFFLSLYVLCRPNRTLARYSLISGSDKSSDIPPPSLSFLPSFSHPFSSLRTLILQMPQRSSSGKLSSYSHFLSFLLLQYVSLGVLLPSPPNNRQSMHKKWKRRGEWRRRRGRSSLFSAFFPLLPVRTPRVPSLSGVLPPFLLSPSLITTVSLNIQ